EESGDDETEKFGKELASLADIYINDAFGSWQPHASTIEPTKHLPSYAGFLMQKEIENLDRVLNPERPLLAVVAGSKFDTKIGPLTALLNKADYLVLGGVIYNAYLAAKYGFKIKGIEEDDVKAAENFLKQTGKYPEKIVELPYIIESDILEEKIEKKYRVHNIYTTDKGNNFNYILDISPKSFATAAVRDIFNNSKTIFVNAVMGFTPNFAEGTIALNTLINENKEAAKLFGGGDTLQDFKTFLPEIYNKALQDDKYYFFTGGGTILKAIEAGSPFGLEPIKAILNCTLTEKRAGYERRNGEDRRKEQKPVKFDRRRGGDRRSGIDRRQSNKN
ncbi:MAG: phosphoglycerate kinase, partial [Candidatus Cloacimonadota bacterium]